MKRTLGTAASTVGLVAALAGCSAQGDPAQTSSAAPPAPIDSLLTSTEAATKPVEEVSWGFFAQLATLDPAKSIPQGGTQVIGNLCEPLLLVQPDFSVTDNLATLTRDGDTTLVLALVDATFWDGQPVTADDVVYSLGRILDPTVASQWAPYFANVSDISARDEKTVEITMKQPDALFEAALGTLAGAVMEREFSEAAGEALGSLQGDVMCSGPFKFAGSTASSITLERNADYWNADRAPLTDELVINFLVDGATASAALTSGDVQGMYNFPASATEALRTSGSGTIYLGQSTSQFSYVIGNMPDNPLNDVRLRQALSLALDRSAISSKVFGESGSAATSFYGSAINGQLDGGSPDVLAPAPDVAAAQALVDEAVAENGKPRPIILSYTSGVGPEVGQMFIYLQQVAEKLGLSVQLIDEAPPVWYDRILAAPTKPSFDVTFTYGGPVIADPLAVLLDFVPGAQGNYTGYSSDAVDQALADGRQSSDDATRDELALAANAQLAQDLPRIPVANVANPLFMNKAITGVPASSAANGYPWAAVLGAK